MQVAWSWIDYSVRCSVDSGIKKFNEEFDDKHQVNPSLTNLSEICFLQILRTTFGGSSFHLNIRCDMFIISIQIYNIKWVIYHNNLSCFDQRHMALTSAKTYTIYCSLFESCYCCLGSNRLVFLRNNSEDFASHQGTSHFHKNYLIPVGCTI